MRESGGGAMLSGRVQDFVKDGVKQGEDGAGTAWRGARCRVVSRTRRVLQPLFSGCWVDLLLFF